jgi:hypothetical protein
MSDLPDWTPGPGTYPVKSDFEKRMKEKEVHVATENDKHIELEPAWDQKGYGYANSYLTKFRFGNGTRTIQKEYGTPGPGAYKHNEDVSNNGFTFLSFCLQDLSQRIVLTSLVLRRK